MYDKEESEADRTVEKMVRKEDIKSLIKSLRLPGGEHGIINRMIRRRSVTALASISERDPDKICSARFLFSSSTAQLVNELENDDEEVRKGVVAILENMKWQPASEAERVSFLLAKEDFMQVVSGGTPAVESFVRWLCDKWLSITDRAPAVKATLALADAGDMRAVKPLLLMINCFKSTEEHTAITTIVKALAKLTRSDISPICKVFSESLNTTGQVLLGWVFCEAGNKNASEPFLDWLHQDPNRTFSALEIIGRVSDLVRSIIPAEALENLFGLYAEIVLDLFVLDPLLPGEWDVSKHANAVTKLCAIKTAVSSNLLLRVAKSDRIQLSYTPKSWSGMAEVVYVDVGKITGQAERELALRGRPRYDPKAYLQP